MMTTKTFFRFVVLALVTCLGMVAAYAAEHPEHPSSQTEVKTDPDVQTPQTGDPETPVPNSPWSISPVLVGETLPLLRLETPEGESFDVNPAGPGANAASADSPVVLVFYRGGWCPFCNRQLSGLQNALPDLQALGYRILAVSPDRPGILHESMEKNGLSYTLLSDHAMIAARRLGIAFRVDAGTLAKYAEHGIDLEAVSGEDHHLLPVPAVFVIGRDGIIKFSYINPDYRVRLDFEVLLAAARSALR